MVVPKFHCAFFPVERTEVRNFTLPAGKIRK
jgi:hypothetical protein